MTLQTHIEDELKRIFEVAELTPALSLVDMDSLSRTEVIILFEEAAGVEITDAELKTMKTLGDLEKFLTEKTRG